MTWRAAHLAVLPADAPEDEQEQEGGQPRADGGLGHRHVGRGEQEEQDRGEQADQPGGEHGGDPRRGEQGHRRHADHGDGENQAHGQEGARSCEVFSVFGQMVGVRDRRDARRDGRRGRGTGSTGGW